MTGGMTVARMAATIANAVRTASSAASQRGMKRSRKLANGSTMYAMTAPMAKGSNALPA